MREQGGSLSSIKQFMQANVQTIFTGIYHAEITFLH